MTARMGSNRAMSQSSETVLSQIAEQAQFAAMPDVISRLITLFDDPETTAAEVAEILSKDAGLVTHVLRIANSAHEIADAPAPEIVRRTWLCFFPTITSALANPAAEMIAVPC